MQFKRDLSIRGVLQMVEMEWTFSTIQAARFISLESVRYRRVFWQGFRDPGSAFGFGENPGGTENTARDNERSDRNQKKNWLDQTKTQPRNQKKLPLSAESKKLTWGNQTLSKTCHSTSGPQRTQAPWPSTQRSHPAWTAQPPQPANPPARFI